MIIELRHIAGQPDGLPVLIATMHGKEQVLAPRLASAGFKVMLPLGYDTDTLGTFSGDVRRPGTAFEAALEKARRACRATGIARAISSEGSYRPSQTLFPGATNVEILAYVDIEAEIEVVDYALNVPTRFAQGRVRPNLDDPALGRLLEQIGWPEVRAIVVPTDPGSGVAAYPVFKGIADTDSLAQALSLCAQYSPDGLVHVETDLRAHMNPTRMASIALVADQFIPALKARVLTRDARSLQDM